MLSLIAELYRLSKQNQIFLHGRYADAEAAMENCKKIIAICLFPDMQRDHLLQFAKAKKAVADFYRLVSESVLRAELMVFFLEQGNAFTVEYGHYLFLKTIIPSRKATRDYLRQDTP